MKMGIEAMSRRNVKHYIQVKVTGDDHWDLEEPAYLSKRERRPFRVEAVTWPSRYTEETEMADDTQVRCGGSLYKKDGSVGLRGTYRVVNVGDLPEKVADALRSEFAKVYSP